MSVEPRAPLPLRRYHHGPHASPIRDGVTKAAAYSPQMTPAQRRAWHEAFAQDMGWPSAEAMRRAVRRLYGA